MIGNLVEVAALGGVTFAVATATAALFVSSLRSFAAVASCGPLLILLYVGFVVLSAPTSYTPDCGSDCGAVAGHFVDPVIFVLAVTNAVGWLTGVAFGVGVRRIFRSS